VIGYTIAASSLLRGLVRPGGPQVAQAPVVQGFFSPTLANNWCAQWRFKDFDGERPPLPAAPVERMSYRT